MGETATVGLHFVVSNSVEKPNPELRKFIRSHVMMGKNRGKTLPLRKRKQKEIQDPSSSSCASSASLRGHDAPSALPTTVAIANTLSHEVLLAPATVPRKFGSDVSTFQFPIVLEPGTIEIILQCTLSLVISYASDKQLID
jgi:hypothetical protein